MLVVTVGTTRMGDRAAEALVSPLGSMRPEMPALRERGLVEQMEEAREAGLGGWFNGMDQGLPRELEWAQL